MADDDLDAAFAEFEDEIKNVPLAGEDAASGKLAGKTEVRPSQEAPAAENLVPARVKDGSSQGPVVLASAEAVAAAPQPEWQRSLQERDAHRMQTKRAAQVVFPTSRDSNGLNKAGTAGSMYALRRQDNAGELQKFPLAEKPNAVRGAWVWDGWQWIWEVNAPTNPTPLGGENAVGAGPAGSDPSGSHATDEPNSMRKKGVRAAAGTAWVDPSLEEWPEDDFRIFVGDLAPDATEEELKDAFSKYASYNMSRVVVDKRTGEGRGYGFVSFAKGEDMVAALREMNGKYVGTRPAKLKKSDWQKRTLTSSRRKDMNVLKSTGLVRKKRRHNP
jgi:RNA recognition motif. (a.k.a. RRM, RBD, or RNP domain)